MQILFALPVLLAFYYLLAWEPPRLPTPWRFAQLTLLAVAALAGVGWWAAYTGDAWQWAWFELSLLRATVLLLIAAIGLVVTRYAARNFANDDDESRFFRWLTLTIASVQFTILSNHLLLFWLGWVAISLSLHQLLMFYPDRFRAALAARKKFIVARLGETLLATAFLLLYQSYGSASISEITSAAATQGLGVAGQIAMLLIAGTAILKCAQLPLHGWLIQIVESPTPVSALLHAGIINLGGFLLLLFAPLLSLALPAQILLLLVAGVTTVLAALIMTTRISIKVRLAWSTSAQMGLMLLECALGLYELALLHLIAHSCYKAYAFLTAGEAVNTHLADQLALPPQPSLRRLALALAVSIALVALVAVSMPGASHVTPWVVIAIAAAAIMVQHAGAEGRLWSWLGFAIGSGLLLLYVVQKQAFGVVLAGQGHYWLWADIWALSLVLMLLFGWVLMNYRPRSHYARHLFVAMNAGLYLDEWVSRTTLALWPKALPLTRRQELLRKERFV